MFEMLQKFVWLTAAAACVWLIYRGIKQLIEEFQYRLQKHRGKQIIERAKSMGPVLYYNNIGKVTAFCRVRDFEFRASFLKSQAQPWELEEEVWVHPTFVFREDGLKSRVHVMRLREQAREMFDTLVEQVTGFTKNQVGRVTFEKAQEILIMKNPQLFVPFATKLSEEEGKRQLNFYGNTPPFSEVREYLLTIQAK